MAMDLFNLGRPQLDRWKTGDVVEHNHLNQSLDAIDDMTRGVGGPREIVRVAEEPATEREVVLRAFFNDDPGSQFVIVQEVQPEIVDGVWTGEIVTLGEPLTVNVWSNTWAELYKPFLWEPLEIDIRATILPLVMIGGVWRLKQQPKMGIQRRKGPVRLLDCTTVSP